MKNAKEMILVLGPDEKGKPHAAKFDLAQADAVRKAAGLMGFRTAIPKSEEAIALADRLPPGKLFATGKGMLPFCPAAAYEKLLKAMELEPEAAKPPAGPTKPVPGPSNAAAGAGWADLKVGDTVIAPDKNPSENGWWKATVIAISGGKLTLRWLDAPRHPPVSMRRQAVALLYPS